MRRRKRPNDMQALVQSADWAKWLDSSLTPAPYEKAQASDVICKRAAHPGSGLIRKNVVFYVRARSGKVGLNFARRARNFNNYVMRINAELQQA